MDWKKILVAVDFSPDSDAAIDAAFALARGTNGTITLLHVCELPAYSTPTVGMYVPSPELVQDLLQAAKATIEEYRQRCAAHGLAVDVACVVGLSASAEVVDYATTHGFDLIVIGSHGRTGVRRLLLGSVAERIVRTADRPVLTVHAHDGAPARAATDAR
jgi:nucleotide-binding universal stress UspA family protein